MTFEYLEMTGADTARSISVLKWLVGMVSEVPPGQFKKIPELAQTEIILLNGMTLYVLEPKQKIMDQL